MNTSMKQQRNHRHREQIRGCQVGGGEGGMDFGISRCPLVYIGWINKVLLYSTENYIQYPGINHNEEEFIYIYGLPWWLRG